MGWRGKVSDETTTSPTVWRYFRSHPLSSLIWAGGEEAMGRK